jgi:hypothetical protein
MAAFDAGTSWRAGPVLMGIVFIDATGLRDGSTPEICEPAAAGCAGREAEALRPSGLALCGRADRSRAARGTSRSGVVLRRLDLGRGRMARSAKMFLACRWPQLVSGWEPTLPEHRKVAREGPRAGLSKLVEGGAPKGSAPAGR